MEEQEKKTEPEPIKQGEKTEVGKKPLDLTGIKDYNSVIITVIAAIAAIICVVVLSNGFVSAKRGIDGGITATGSASVDFESDLVVWRGEFTAFDTTMKNSYGVIKRDGDLIKKYLEEQGVTDTEMVFSSVNISASYTTIYDDEGLAIRDVLDGYNLSQSLTVTSTDIDKVENVSRDITKLIESDVEFTSYSPEYYYTKLDEVKLDLIEKATANATQRIDIMKEGTNSNLGKLTSASLGVFQITAKNSGPGEYSYDGTFDTSSREKTAMITVRLDYQIQ